MMEVVAEKLNKKILESASYIQAELIRNTPVGFTGKLRRDWRLEIEWTTENNVKMVKVTISNPSVYGVVVDEGRRAAPVSKEGRKSLEMWARRKLRVTEKESKSVAFLIARKKSKFPTKGQNFIKKTLEEVMPRVISSIEKEFDTSVKATSLVRLNEGNCEILEHNSDFEKGIKD